MTDQSKASRRPVMLKGALVVASLIAAAALWNAAEKNNEQPCDPAARDAGRRLRVAINKFNETLPVDNTRPTFVPSAHNGPQYADISSIFREYVRVDQSFIEGEAILRCAGLEVVYSPVKQPGKEVYSELPTTRADLTKFEILKFQYMYVTASLKPAKPDDYTAIGSVDAYIRKTPWQPFRDL